MIGYKGSALTGNQNLRYYSIKNKCKLHLSVCESKGMNFQFNTLINKRIDQAVDCSADSPTLIRPGLIL